jgi:hypothetical protein
MPQRRTLDIDEGDRLGAAVPRRPEERHDIGALAGLRDGERRLPLEMQPRAVDGHDRGAERGDRPAGEDLGRILEIGRRVVGRAARDGDGDGGSKVGKAPCDGLHRLARAVEKTADGLRDLGDLAGHEAGVGHGAPPPDRLSSATKS